MRRFLFVLALNIPFVFSGPASAQQPETPSASNKTLHNSETEEQTYKVCNQDPEKAQLRVFVGKDEKVALVPFGECRDITALRISVEPTSGFRARGAGN